MDARMHLIARSVQLAVMAAPSSTLDEAVAAARRHRESLTSALRRALAPATRSPRMSAG